MRSESIWRVRASSIRSPKVRSNVGGDARDSANVDEEGILEQASSLGARKHLERASSQDARRACPRVRMLTTMRATPRHAACIPRVVDDAQLW